MRRFDPTILIFLGIMAYMAISDGRFANPVTWLTSTLILLPGIIIGIAFHEFAHAYSAYKLGDYTPKIQGRVTLNPIKHLDPIGTLLIIFIGFGWGRPVMVNPENFKKRRRDDIIVSLAGVTTNLILAIVFTIVLVIFSNMVIEIWIDSAGRLMIAPGATAAQMAMANIILSAIRINLVLMVFNLLPIPPLDGFNVISSALRLQHTKIYYMMYQYGMFIVMALIIFDVIRTIMSFTVIPMYDMLLNFAVG